MDCNPGIQQKDLLQVNVVSARQLGSKSVGTKERNIRREEATGKLDRKTGVKDLN